MKLSKKQMITLGLVLLGVVVTLFAAYKLVPTVMVMWTKAAPATRVSVTDSYVLGEKILAEANGEDSCKINVFLMDKNGKPVTGQTADLSGAGMIEAVNQLSDSKGMISYEIKSSSEGQYKMQASYMEVPLGVPVTVTFRNSN